MPITIDPKAPLKTARDIDVAEIDPLDGEPTSHWIVCEKLDRLNMSEGGIVLPDTADLETTFVLVHSVGPGPVSAHTDEHLTKAMMGIERGDVLELGSRYHGVGSKDRRVIVRAKVTDVVQVYKGLGLR